jgi:hypothetical protein
MPEKETKSLCWFHKEYRGPTTARREANWRGQCVYVDRVTVRKNHEEIKESVQTGRKFSIVLSFLWENSSLYVHQYSFHRCLPFSCCLLCSIISQCDESCPWATASPILEPNARFQRYFTVRSTVTGQIRLVSDIIQIFAYIKHSDCDFCNRGRAKF